MWGYLIYSRAGKRTLIDIGYSNGKEMADNEDTHKLINDKN